MLRYRCCSARRQEAGQSTVEFALALPVIVIALLLVVQVGVVVRDSLIVHDLAREAARAAAVDPTPAAAQGAVLMAGSSLESSRIGTKLEGGALSGDLVTATVSYQSPTTVPIVGILIGDVPLSAEVTMRVE